MLIIDTGVLLAAADNTDRAHTACVDLVETTSDTLITTALVVAETGYMIERQLGPVAEARFYSPTTSQRSDRSPNGDRPKTGRTDWANATR